MSAPPHVRLSREAEIDAISALLSDAFVNEDGLNYWLKQGPKKDHARKRFFDVAVRDAINPKRDLWIAESEGERLGAAIWLAPGLKSFDWSFLEELTYTPLFFSIAGIKGMGRARQLGAKLTQYHPQQPHAHLAFLGVAPAAQGKGVGSAILKATLAPLDAQGTAAYLEASDERNVALYLRHGFEVTGEFDLPGLHFWTMLRQPQR